MEILIFIFILWTGFGALVFNWIAVPLCTHGKMNLWKGTLFGLLCGPLAILFSVINLVVELLLACRNVCTQQNPESLAAKLTRWLMK